VVYLGTKSLKGASNYRQKVSKGANNYQENTPKGARNSLIILTFGASYAKLYI
jgi:hypothetical protein